MNEYKINFEGKKLIVCYRGTVHATFTVAYSCKC